MENPNSELNQQARAYFLEQGKSVGRLHDILNSNIVSHYAKRWVSVLLEVLLYLIFISVVTIILMASTELSLAINEDFTLKAEMRSEEIVAFFLLVKVILIILSLPLLLFALLLGRNRRKNIKIREAYEETEKMKMAFDNALRSLKL